MTPRKGQNKELKENTGLKDLFTRYEFRKRLDAEKVRNVRLKIGVG